MPSISIDVVTTVVYGTTATIIGLVTIYQSYIAWRLWREHHHRHHPGQSSRDVELALGSVVAVQQAPSSTATVDIVPNHAINDVQALASQVTASVSPRPLGPSTSSTADPESVEVRSDSQDAASPGIALDAAVAPALQPLQPPEPPDVAPIQDMISTHAAANPEDPSVSCPASCPALIPPDVPSSPSTPVHSTDGS